MWRLINGLGSRLIRVLGLGSHGLPSATAKPRQLLSIYALRLLARVNVLLVTVPANDDLDNALMVLVKAIRAAQSKGGLAVHGRLFRTSASASRAPASLCAGCLLCWTWI